MMGYTAPSKAAIKRAIAEHDFNRPEHVPSVLDFWRNVQETSLFGAEARVPGQNLVVGPDAYTNRKWYATLTVNERGIVTSVK